MANYPDISYPEHHRLPKLIATMTVLYHYVIVLLEYIILSMKYLQRNKEEFLVTLKYFYLIRVMLLGTYYAVHNQTFPYLNGFWYTADQYCSGSWKIDVLLYL